jgi:two-component system, response regulator YesN
VGNIIRYDRLPENYKKDSYPLLKEFEVKMERQVPLLAAGKLVLIGEEAMNRAVEGQYRYYRLYGLLEEMLERTGLVFSDIMKDYEIPDAEPYIRRLENCTTLNQLKLVWADYVSVSCELCQRQKDGMGSRPVRMIKEYIGEHYSENITLNDIADIVFLNPAYLSAMFKKETGQTLTQYLIDVRIDKAKEMLRNPERTIGEIACMVGYQDERHFSKLFSKMTGVKPTEYRRFYV